MLQYASDELKADKKVVLAALKKDHSAFTHVHTSLKKDGEDVSSFIARLERRLERLDRLLRDRATLSIDE